MCSSDLARTGYTGEDGFEIFAPAGHLLQLYPALLKTGADYGLAPCGLGARDTLRLEMGYRLYGNDLDEHHSPLEAGLGWVVKLEKGDFVGREALLSERTKGSLRRFVGLRLLERGVPRHGSVILVDGNEVGQVSSGGFSPTLQTGIAMGYVESARFPPGKTPLFLQMYDRYIPAEEVPLPFYRKKRS